jgi:lambda repressor-like predicted transcriptional regulator
MVDNAPDVAHIIGESVASLWPQRYNAVEPPKITHPDR